MKIAMTGVSGNMGAEALRQTLGLPGVERVRVLLTRRKKNEGLAHRLAREYGQRLRIDSDSMGEMLEAVNIYDSAKFNVYISPFYFVYKLLYNPASSDSSTYCSFI